MSKTDTTADGRKVRITVTLVDQEDVSVALLDTRSDLDLDDIMIDNAFNYVVDHIDFSALDDAIYTVVKPLLKEWADMTEGSLDSYLKRCHLCGGEASVVPDPNARETGVPNHVVCKRCGDEFHIVAETPTIKTGEDTDIMSLTGCSERDATLVCWWNQHQRANGTSYSVRSIDPEAYVVVGDIDEGVQRALDEGWDTRRLARFVLKELRNGRYPD